MNKKPPGRPTVITPEVVSILSDCFRRGMSAREACAQSVISHEAYYYRIRNDKKFADRMYAAQQQPSIKAKQLLVEAINKGDLGVAKWWLEHKEANEFSKLRNPEPAFEVIDDNTELSELSDEQLFQLTLELNHLRVGEFVPAQER